MKADKVESCFRKRLAWKAKTFANPIFDERLRGQLPHCRGSDVVRHSTFRLPGYGPGPEADSRLAPGWQWKRPWHPASVRAGGPLPRGASRCLTPCPCAHQA